MSPFSQFNGPRTKLFASGQLAFGLHAPPDATQSTTENRGKKRFHSSDIEIVLAVVDI